MSHQRYEADLRRLMAGFPTGVSVVTATAPDGVPWGMTCTSLCSVALDPPTLLVCLRRDSPTLEAVLAGGTLSVNLLHQHARSTAELFGSGAADRFDRIPWVAATDGGPHLVEAAHTIADCVVTEDQAVGDHTIVMARVTLVTSLRSPCHCCTACGATGHGRRTRRTGSSPTTSSRDHRGRPRRRVRTAMDVSVIAPYPMPGAGHSAANRVDWVPDPARAVLLLLNMQGYFLRPYTRGEAP